MATKRAIEHLGYDVSDDVLHAIELLKRMDASTECRDSGHKLRKGGRPTWVFKLPRFDAEVGVPMNRRHLTLYMRNRTLDGRKLTDLLSDDKIAKVYPKDGQPARSIKDSPFLGSASGNECVMLALERDDLQPLFDTFFAAAGSTSGEEPSPAARPASASPSSGTTLRIPIDAEAFAALLERRSEIGEAGELLVLAEELSRLAQLGCPDPRRWVQRVALTDVGRGYDIESTWPAHERCIEVKTTTGSGNDFFLTENEIAVLTDLGPRAWLYRVVLKPDGSGNVVARVRGSDAVYAGHSLGSCRLSRRRRRPNACRRLREHGS